MASQKNKRKTKTLLELENEAAVIRRDLDVLASLSRQRSPIKQARAQLRKELESVERRIEALTPQSEVEIQIERVGRRVEANLARSRGQRKYAHYIRQVRDTHAPDMSIPEVKKDFKKFKTGKPSKLKKVHYFNPSL